MTRATTHCIRPIARLVAYEISMFHFLSEYFASVKPLLSGTIAPLTVDIVGTSDVKDEVAAMLESLLLHARALYHFFSRTYEPNSRFSDDVFATDFVAKWDFAWAKNACPYLLLHLDRLNKALAHLSIERERYAQTIRGWEISTLCGELQIVIDRFKAELSDDKQEWFAPGPD